MNDKQNLLAVHLNHLEEDAAGQAQFMFLYGRDLADARRKVKELKNQLKVLSAKLSLDIRQDHTSYGLTKLTEDGVEAVLWAMPEYQELTKDIIQAEYEEDLLEQFSYAIRERGEQITNEIKLFGMSYFSKPNTEESKESHRIEQMRESAETMNSSTKRRSK